MHLITEYRKVSSLMGLGFFPKRFYMACRSELIRPDTHSKAKPFALLPYTDTSTEKALGIHVEQY